MADYTEDMKMTYYTETDEIEIVDEGVYAHMYFKNIRELANLINSSPRLAKELKGLLP